MNVKQTATRTAKDFAEEKIASPSGGTHLGYHFISKYIENPWEWFLKYVRCLEPEHTPTALIHGGAFHDALEYGYLHGDPEGMVYVYREIMASRREEYADPQAYEQDVARGPKELLYWANQWLEHDRREYEILGVELPLEVPLPGDLTMTMRLDLVVRSKKDRDVYIIDHKTTGWSISGTVKSMDIQDQVTAYLYGLSQVRPDWSKSCLGLIPDVIYHKGSVIKAERPTVLTRTRSDLWRFSLEMQGALTEMAQKVTAFARGQYHPYQLFPRNGKDAAMFGRVDYPDLQRMPLPADMREAPPGYRIDHDRMENVLRPFMEASEALTQNQTETA